MTPSKASVVPFIPPVTLKVTPGPQLRSKVRIVAGFMPAGVLIPNNYVIPYYDSRTKKGYQRQPQDVRVNELVSDLRNDRVDLPTAILLNIRNPNVQHALKGDILDLTVLRESGGATHPVFYIVDGQHRVLALQKLIKEHDVDRWSHLQIPFVCLLGADENEEMDQFYIVNSKAKSVRTDLAYALLRQRAELDPDVLDQLLEKGKEWVVKAEKLIEQLSETGAVWRGLIRLPGMDKGPTTMPSASMVVSLRPLLTSPFFGQMSQEKQLQVIDTYWRGLRDLFKEAFDEPSKFVIQKGMGVMVMHAILVQVLEIARSQGRSVIEAETYADILRDPLEKLQGENQAGLPVSGLEFWRGAPNGAAATFSSSAGRRVLIAKIRQLLPKIEVE